MYEMNGMDAVNASIRKSIENRLSTGQRSFIIFPFGDIGMRVKNILNVAYGIAEEAIVDNRLCRYNKKIYSSKYLENFGGGTDVCVILATTNSCIYEELKGVLRKYFTEDSIEELDIMTMQNEDSEDDEDKNEPYHHVVGKYSYGPLTAGKNECVESVGSFCSFAVGSDVVPNHAVDYITTHPMIYFGSEQCMYGRDCHNYGKASHATWYFPGVLPRGIVRKSTRSRIGNDVWLGRNVIITNGANIGNGVIAAAGAVITRDVPDYAIVAGVPAKIIRYRYNDEQIAALNKIAWWNWTDEEIRERYDDFYLPVDDFIKKYLG